MQVDYKIEILDNSLNKITEVKTPYPLDKNGMIIQYSKELSDFGQCKFRISAFDNLWADFGDIVFPHQYHVRIKRNGGTVWQGAIIENTKRNMEYIEITAAEYEWYLSKILVNRTSNNPGTGQADGIYRIFSSGTMSTAVTNIMNETITNIKNANSAHILSTMTLGTIENPNFPPNMTDNTGVHLSGAWNFSTNLQLTYDFNNILYILKSFGIYTYSDFYVDNSLVFNFEKFVGNDRHYDVNFSFIKNGDQAQSNIIDYSLPRLGQRMVNSLYGIATDTNGKVLNYNQRDEASITKYGLMQGVAAYADIKDQGILDARTRAELPLISTPDETNAIVVLNETAAYPLGLWDIGDIVTIKVKNNGVDFDEIRRIVGVTVAVHDTGREFTTVQTNIPLPWQYGSTTA